LALRKLFALSQRVTLQPETSSWKAMSLRGFGSRLRQLRRDRNLTQMQMARRFGMDRSYISEVERGRKSISLVTLELIALGFRMSLSDVMVDI
jgi:DNA-binding XRE family transcriptional regulator